MELMMKFSSFFLAIFLGVAASSCQTVTDQSNFAQATDFPEPKKEDKRLIELRFQVVDKKSGKYIEGWSAQIQRYDLNNKRARSTRSKMKPASGSNPTVSFTMTSGDLLPPQNGYLVYITRYNQEGVIIDMMDYLERVSVSKDIIYRLD